MGKFQQALAYLLPRGFAWPRDPASTVMRWLAAFAGMLEEAQAFFEQTVWEWQPHRTATRLAEWEEATGLPDACFATDEATRRQMLLMRLRGPELPYEDSSPAAPAVLAALCESVGYPATVAYNVPLRVGGHVGQRLGALDGVLHVTATLPSGRMRVGTAKVGQRLIYGSKTGSDLACLLERVVPARFDINLILI